MTAQIRQACALANPGLKIISIMLGFFCHSLSFLAGNPVPTVCQCTLPQAIFFYQKEKLNVKCCNSITSGLQARGGRELHRPREADPAQRAAAQGLQAKVLLLHF